jgi:hypothetical protein
MGKIKDWLLFILAILVSIFFASSWASNKKAEKRLKDAKKKIDKAGEDVEAKNYKDADNAAHAIDNILSNIESRNSDE